MNLNEIPAWSDIESQPWFAELTPEEKQQSLQKWQGDMMQFAKDPKEKFAVAATAKAKARSFFGEEMPDDPIADALQRRQKDLGDIGSRYDAFSKGQLEEDDEEVLTLNDTLKGNTPYSVIKGRLFVSPQLVWDKAAYEKVVNEAPVDEDERVLAMSAYDGSKERAAEGVVNSLGYTDEAFRDFAAKGFKEGKSNAAVLDEWKANNKLPDGILGSLRGVGRQAYFGLRSGLSGLERAMGGLGGFFGSESAQKYAEESGKEAQSYMQRTLGEGPEFIGELTSGAVSIIPTIAAGAAASFFTEGAALPAAASITAGAIQSAGATQAETYEFYRNQGLDHANALAESRVDGLVSGLITGAITHYAGKLGDKIGLGKGIEGLFSGPASKIASKLTQREISESLKAGAKAVGGSFLQEGSEELLDQAAQDAYSMIKRDPTLTLAEAINNALQAGKVGAVLGGAAEAGKIGLKSLLNSAKFAVPTTEEEEALRAKFEVPAAVEEEVIASPEVQQEEQNVKTAADVVKETAPVAPQTAAVLAGITEEKAGELAADVVVKTGDALASVEEEAPLVVDETPLVSPASETAPISETPAVTTAPLAPILTEETRPPQGKPVEPPTNAAPEIPIKESLRQEPQDRVEVGTPEETGAGDSIQRAAEGEKEVARSLEERFSEIFNSPLPKGDPRRAEQDAELSRVRAARDAARVAAADQIKVGDRIKNSNTGRVVTVTSIDPATGRVDFDGVSVGATYMTVGDFVPTTEPATVVKKSTPVEELPIEDLTPDKVKQALYARKTKHPELSIGDLVWSASKGVGTVSKKLKAKATVSYDSGETEQVIEANSIPPNVAAWLRSRSMPAQLPSPPTTGAVPTETLPDGQEVTPGGVASPGVARDTTKPEQMTPEELLAFEKAQAVASAEEALQRAKKGQEVPNVFLNGFKSKAALVRAREQQLEEARNYSRKPDVWNLVIEAAQAKKPISAALVESFDDRDVVFGAGPAGEPGGVSPSPRKQVMERLQGYVKQGELYVYEKTQPLPKGDAAGERGAVAPAPAVEPAPEAQPVSQPVQAFRDAVSQMSPTAQAKWTPELRATAEAYLDSGGTTGLQGLSDVQQKVVGRFLPEDVKAAFDAEDARKRAQRNKLPDHRESSLPPTPGKQIRKIGKGAMESVPVVLDEIAKVIPNIRDLVEVRESVEGEPDAEGFYDPQADKAVVLVDNVYLKPQHGGSQEAALRETIIHELLHRGFAKLRQTNPQLFEQFEAYSLADTNDAQFEALVRRGYSMYSNWKDDPAQNQKAREEIFIRKAVVDLNFKGIDAIKSPTSLASQFFSWLRGLLNKLLGRKVDDETLLHWSRVFLNAAQADFIEKTPGERMHAFAGEKAIENLPEERRQFMRDSLETAKAMAAAGKDSEEIRAVTGWFPGKYDGKMRWEVPDEGASLKVSETIRAGYSAEDVLSHPDLFSAYPELKSVRVAFTPMREGMRGSFDGFGTGRIEINSNLDDAEKLSTLLHEIQHWVQRKEGFSSGGNPDQSIRDARVEANEKMKSLNERIMDNNAVKVTARFRGDEEAYQKAIDTERELVEERHRAWEIGQQDPIQLYRSLAGEIEARDVQARQNFTPEQRAATAPYSSENIAKEDAIVMFGGGGAQMSMASPEKYARHAELEAKHNAGTITPEETAEARALVEEAAKAAGYSVGPVFHGTSTPKITEFYGGWWSERKAVTSEFGDIRYQAYLKGPFADGDALREMWIEYEGTDANPDDEEGGVFQDSEIADFAMSGSQFTDFVRGRGYNGIEVFDESNRLPGMAWAVFDSNQIKSADPFTGVRLEQRFQPTSPDIRYSLGEPPDMQAEADALREVTPSSQALDKFRETFGTPRQDVGQVLGKKEGSVYTQAQVAPLIEYARSMIGFENDANGDPIISPEATQRALNMVAKINGTPGFASQFNVRAAEVFKGKPVDPEIATAVLTQELQVYANRLSASSPKAEDQILKVALTPFYNTQILGSYLSRRIAGRTLQAASMASGETGDARKSREEAEKAVNKEITKQLGDEALPAAEGMDKAGVEGGVEAIKDDIPAPADPTLRLLDLAVESLDEVAKAKTERVFDILFEIGQLEELVAQDEKVGNKAMSILRNPNLAARNYPTDPAERKALLAQKKAELATALDEALASLQGAKPETKKKVKERATKAGGKAKTAPKVSDKEEDPITKEINALAAELGTLSKLDQAGLDVVKQIAKKLVAKFQPAKLDALKDKVEAVVYKYVQNAERLELAEFSEKMTADLDAIGLKKPELQEALVAKAWAYHFAAPTKAVQALTAKMKSAERADRGGPESVANVRKAINGAVNSTEENRDAFVTRLTDQLVALGVEAQTAEAAAKAAFEYRAKQADKKIERVMETLRLGKRRALLKSFQNTKEADRTEEWQRATLKAAFVEAGLTNKQAEKGADKAMQEAEAIFATAEMKVAEIKQRSVQKFLDSLASVEDETPVTKTKQDNLRSVFKDATLDEEFNEAVLMDRFQTLGATEAQAKALVEKVAEVREDKAEALAEAKRKQVNKVIDATYKRIAQLESGTPSEKAKKQESLRNAVGAAIKAKEFDEAAFRASVASFGASEPQVETLVQNVKKLRQLGESKPLSKAKLRQFLLSFPKNVLANPEQREALLRSFLKGKEYSEAEINRIVPQVLRDFDTGYQKARKAYLDELEKKLKPKQGQKESKQDQQNRKMLNALRSGLADTTSEASVALAKSLGFEAFRPQDDHILSKLDEEMRKLREQDRISDANAKFVQIRDLLNRRRPPRDFMQVAAQGWITSALSSLSNFAVNVWAPLGEAGVRFTSDILRAAATGRIDEIPLYLEAAIQALKSMPPRAKFAFKTDTFTNSVNTLIADMASMKDELQRALNTYRSKDSSKLAKAAAAGRILFTIGDLSRRVLSTVDDTWYTALSSYIGSSNLIKDLRDAKLPKAAVQAIAFHANNDAIHQAQAEHATLDAVSQFVESLRGKTEEEIDAGLEYLGLNDASVTQAQADYIQEIVSALQSLRIRSGATGDDLVKRALKEISNFKAAVNVRAVELGQARTKELLATALTEVGQTPQQIEEAQRNYDENAKKAASFGMGLHRVEGVPSYDIMGKAVQIVDAMGRGAVTTSPLLGRMMVGFFGIPLNLLNKSLWFTPYGLGRYFLAKWQMAKNPEEKFYEYSMSSQREMSQRVNEIIIGHTIMAAAFALGAIRDQEDEEGEGLYITLGGPSNKTEYDAWYARGFRKFSFCYKTKDGSVAAVPYGRGMGEVLKMPLMLLGAFDDMRLNKKLGDREDMSSIIEYLNSAAAGIGNQATFLGAKNTVGAFAPDKIGANTASSLAYAVSNLVPFNGLDRSIAALAVGPPDRSRTGAILANIPIARWLATDPAINVFGDKWGNKSDANFAVLWDRQWNQGLIPLNISAPLTGQDKRLYGFIGERLIGPSPALRGALELRNGYVTDKQWYDYSIYRGQALKREMVTQLDRLRRMDDDSLSKAIAELSTKATKKAKDRFNYK